MKLLTISTLFPYENNPKHGIFVETRLRHLKAQYPDTEIKVIAPIPYFPFKSHIFGSYAEFAKAPEYEIRHGMEVFHPRYLVVPKLGMTLTPATIERAVLKQAYKLIKSGYDFDMIDGHYFYPDGVAISRVAAKLGKPFTMTARGTDINLIPKYQVPRQQIQTVLKSSNHNIAVCEALRQEMIGLGAAPDKTTTLRNGVDLTLFPFADEAKKTRLREELGLSQNQPIVISVGHLIERKGHHLVIEAIRHLPDIRLLIAGDGPKEISLKRKVESLNLTDRVLFLGSLSQVELSKYFGAADLSILASNREGWANVLLESMACGTPVVATNIWGTPEVVRTEEAGVLVERDPDSIVVGIEKLLQKLPQRKDTRKYAEGFTWDVTSKGQHHLFSEIIGNK